MLFYISLFIACAIAAILVLYLYHLLSDVGKAVYRAVLPNSKENITRHRSNVRYNSNVNDAQAPWGWEGNNHDTRRNVSISASPNSASGLDGFINKHSNETASAGWLQREDKVELAGTAYKVKRKTTASKKSHPGSNSKQPWGW